MKKIGWLLTVLVMFALLAGCNNFSGPASGGPVKGKGYVRLVLGVDPQDGVTARTLLPSNLTFGAYKLTFTQVPPSGDPIVITGTSLNTEYPLELGAWKLDLIAYSDAEMVTTAAAASNITFSLTTIQPDASVDVPLVFSAMTGNGTVKWAITNYSGITPTKAEITLTPIPSGTTITQNILGNLTSGTINDVPAGYYQVAVVVKDGGAASGGREAAWGDILHVYPGQTTTINHTFILNSFSYTIDKLWIVGITGDWGSDYPNLLTPPMTFNNDGTFSWEGDAADAATFRFSLTDTSTWDLLDPENKPDNPWHGDWLAPASNNTIPVVGANAMTLVTDYTGTHNSWKIQGAGFYQITVDPYNHTNGFTLAKPVIVDSVTITTPPAQLVTGSTYPFTATVNGKNTAGVTVTWSVNSANGSSFGSGVNGNVLTVAAGESAASLTITASAGGKSDTAAIPVKAASQMGNAVINLTIGDKGGSLAIIGGIPNPVPVIYKTGYSTGENEVTFTVDNPGAYTYTWYVDGAAETRTGATVTFNAANYVIGYHTVRLTVTIDTIPWSLPGILSFNVMASK